LKKLLLASIICIATTFVAKAQAPPLNKQQTLDFINELFKKASDYANITVGYTLEKKVLVLTYRNGDKYRQNLGKLNADSIFIENRDNKFIVYRIHQKDNYFFGAIQLEADAIRLKKALEHLIELVKTEKSTDPFDN